MRQEKNRMRMLCREKNTRGFIFLAPGIWKKGWGVLFLAVYGYGCVSEMTKPGGELLLPAGFEAVVVADSLGPARHIAVNDNGDIYVKLRRASERGSIVALRDTTGNGKADIIKQFAVHDTRGSYETGIGIKNGYLYFSTHLFVFRYPMIEGELLPDTTRKQTIVIDDHEHGSHEHIAKPISFDDSGNIYIPYGAPSDVCQEINRMPGSPGLDPCPELEQHGGIWKFFAGKENQVQQESRNPAEGTNATGIRYATGLRSIVAMDWNPLDGELYAVQHGRDNLHRMWPHLFSRWDNAVLPAEEFVRVAEHSDYGWPYCFYDPFRGKRVLAPEYGGDGSTTGRCSRFNDPIIGFPGHYAPNGLHFYRGDQFPEYYQNGAFIAFHGSTIRNPYPQAGYFVAFVPYQNGSFSDTWDVFANGFAGIDPVVNTGDVRHRPMGLATGPDGALYISDSVRGTIWKITFTAGKEDFSNVHRAGMEREKRTATNIRTPDIEKDDLQKDNPGEGEALFQAYCAPCHQSNGEGVAGRFPSITAPQWSGGPKEPLLAVILNGQNTSGYDIPMPAHQFLSDEQAARIATYIRGTFGEAADAVSSEEVMNIRRIVQKENSRE